MVLAPCLREIMARGNSEGVLVTAFSSMEECTPSGEISWKRCVCTTLLPCERCSQARLSASEMSSRSQRSTSAASTLLEAAISARFTDSSNCSLRIFAISSI